MGRFFGRTNQLNENTLLLAQTPLSVLTETSFQQEEAYCAYINVMLRDARLPNSALVFELFTRQYVLDQMASAIKDSPRMTLGAFITNCIFQVAKAVGNEIKKKIEANKNAYYEAPMQLVRMDDKNYILLLNCLDSSVSIDHMAVKLSFDDLRAVLVCFDKMAEPMSMDVRLLADGAMEIEALFSNERSSVVVRFSKNEIIDKVVLLYPGSYLIPDELVKPLLPATTGGTVLSAQEKTALSDRVAAYEARYNHLERVLLLPNDLTQFVSEDDLFFRPGGKHC